MKNVKVLIEEQLDSIWSCLLRSEMTLCYELAERCFAGGLILRLRSRASDDLRAEGSRLWESVCA